MVYSDLLRVIEQKPENQKPYILRSSNWLQQPIRVPQNVWFSELTHQSETEHAIRWGSSYGTFKKLLDFLLTESPDKEWRGFLISAETSTIHIPNISEYFLISRRQSNLHFWIDSTERLDYTLEGTF